MTAKRRNRRAPDPLAGKRHPPFGATKKQAARYQREREFKNQIFELEQHVAALEDHTRQLGMALSAVEAMPAAALANLCADAGEPARRGGDRCGARDRDRDVAGDVEARGGEAMRSRANMKRLAEAEDLRSGIEGVIKELSYTNGGDQCRNLLLRLLDNVDARDSLAYLEARDRELRHARDEINRMRHVYLQAQIWAATMDFCATRAPREVFTVETDLLMAVKASEVSR